jgi:hypothetical protein
MKLPNRTEARELAWQFMLNKNKPSWCQPVDILLTANVIMLSNDEGMCWASQGTLSAMLGIDQSNIRHTLNKLIAHGWITEESRKNSGQSNLLYPQYHNIPFGVFKTVNVCADATKLAGRYYEIVRALPKVLTKNGRMRRAAYQHEGWAQHWSYVMQNWLDAGWSIEQIQTVVDYAFQHVGHIAKRGPQYLKDFPKLAEAAGVKSERVPRFEVPQIAAQ